MAGSEMQDTNDPDLDPQEESSDAQAEAPEPDLSDGEPPSPPNAEEAVETAEEDIPMEDLMHGDGHAAIPEIPSIESDGSIDIDELTPADFEADELRQRLRTMML